MDELADSIKTKSLTEALEPLTEQVLEISSIALRDLEEKPNLMENVQHLSKGIIASTQTFCDILDKKLKYLNPTSIHFKCLKKLLQAAEDVSTSSLQLAKPFENNLEKFQEKTAGFLELMLEVILVWDQEVIVSLKNMTENIRKALVGLSKTQVLHEMVAFYKEFTVQSTEFGEQLCRRVTDLVDRKIQNEFWILLNCIRKLAITFSTAIKNCAKFPLSKHTKISKDFILKELFFLLDELDELLNVDHSSKDNQYATSFLTCVDEVLELIETSHLDDNVMESKIYQILQHSMTVANCSAEDEKYQITRYSQQVLYEFRSLQDLLEKIEQSPGDISLAVDILRDFLELLEQSVNHSLLRMMVENLSTCTEPLKLLIGKCSSKSEIEETQRAVSDLELGVKEFDASMERLLQTGYFALASTGDLQKIRTIRCALNILESLEAEMIPAIYNCYLDPENPAAECHLQFLWRSFRDHYDSLKSSLDSIADPLAFCHVAEKVLSDHLALLQKDLYTQDAFRLGKCCQSIIAIATRCIAIVRNQDGGQIFAEKIYLKEVELALREFKGAVALTLRNISELRNHRSMMKRAEILLKYIMKSVDTLKQLQDSDMAQVTSEFAGSTCQKDETRAQTLGSLLSFPEVVSQLPFDPSDDDRVALSKSKIGCTPRKKKHPQRSCDLSQLESKNPSEMTRFISHSQPWRTRFGAFLLAEEETAEMDSPKYINKVSLNSDVSDVSISTFDLTDLLEELTTLEGTLTSNAVNQSFTPCSKSSTELTIYHSAGSVATTGSIATADSIATPMSIGIATPQRLKDLNVVSQRLALLRQMSSDSL